jgi:hypothetical protein
MGTGKNSWGWRWWALTWLLLAVAVYIGYRVIQTRQKAEAESQAIANVRAVFAAKCHRIRKEMTVQEVEEVFGTPSLPMPSGNDETILRVWDEDGGRAQQGRSAMVSFKCRHEPPMRHAVWGAFIVWLDDESGLYHWPAPEK